MPAQEPGKIRNIAVVGHRGTGKTSLVEALLFQSGAVNRLGTVEQGTTVSDWDEDEQRRQMSLSATLTHCEWQERKINILDTPGDAGFQGDAIAATRVVEGELVVVSGVMGVEVGTGRAWHRGTDGDLARVVVVNMLDRERADFFRVLEALRSQLSNRCVAVHIPIGAEHELTGIVDVLHMKAYMSPEGARDGAATEIPPAAADLAAEYREKLLDAVVETDEGLMERYLDGQELSAEEVAKALKNGVTRGEVFPVSAAVATKNLGTTALLDLVVEGVFAGRINLFRVLEGTITADATLTNTRGHGKERFGSLMTVQGKEHAQADAFGPGDIGAVAKLKETMTGDLLLDKEVAVEPPRLEFPEPVMSFAITPKTKGEEEKMGQALRRLTEEDPTLTLRRDAQTGEQLIAGLSQMHVEVAVDRMKRRFGVEVDLHQPRVPYLETIRSESRAQGKYKKQTGGRGQYGDCHIVLEPIEEGVGYEFVDKIVGGVIPQSFRPAVDKGIQEAMQHGELAGAPVQGIRVLLVDGSYHNVDSSEMAFKIAGSMAFKAAYEKASPVLLEPIMELELTVPDDTVGAVNGDLNSRRGRLLGMEPAAGMTTIKAEVPMAEILSYSQALTSLTGGRGDYHMHFLRYDEVPTHIAQKIIDETKKAREAEKV